MKLTRQQAVIAVRMIMLAMMKIGREGKDREIDTKLEAEALLDELEFKGIDEVKP
ncbi:MAG: hypothetical protein WC637_12270 [Victivallales bacterium]|jgi:hypothetical protein